MQRTMMGFVRPWLIFLSLLWGVAVCTALPVEKPVAPIFDQSITLSLIDPHEETLLASKAYDTILKIY